MTMQVQPEVLSNTLRTGQPNTAASTPHLTSHVSLVYSLEMKAWGVVVPVN